MMLFLFFYFKQAVAASIHHLITRVQHRVPLHFCNYAFFLASVMVSRTKSNHTPVRIVREEKKKKSMTRWGDGGTSAEAASACGHSTALKPELYQRFFLLPPLKVI